jgi:hypothetical protein
MTQYNIVENLLYAFLTIVAMELRHNSFVIIKRQTMYDTW